MTGSNFVTLLVDTGADVSLFKRDKVNPDQLIYTHNTSILKGITNGTTKSIGSTFTNIFIEGHSVEHTFQIVDSDFPIPTDAILGKDFIKKYRCNLDYDNWTMTIRLKHTKIPIPIYENPVENILIIPSRCEVIRSLNKLKHISHDVVVLNKEIVPGVFVARSISSKHFPYVKIINTNFENAQVNESQIDITNLDMYNVYNITNERTNEESNLLSELNLNVPNFAKNDMVNLCTEFSDIFALKSQKITTNNFYSQKLKLTDKSPVYIKNYRIPKTQKMEINRQVDAMLQNEIIERSCSEYNNPVLLVPKKSDNGEKKWRLVVDFRQLNKKLVADKFPLPRIDDILDQLGRAKWFSVLDLISGFHQIPLEEQSRDLTSFSTEKGSFRFTRLPFGLAVSPNSFQRMMTMAFAGVTPERAFLYMDDLIVIGCSQKHHLDNLRKVFETCRKFNLKLNPTKCRFFHKEVTYLGHKITDKGILPDDSKYEIIENYPIPENADAVKRFVAFCNYYRRFIPNFAEISAPLNKLTRKTSTFLWTDECQNAFETLKKALVSPKILQYPDFTKQFTVTTDASKEACGAVLSQNFDGNDLPIAYASRSFTKGEIHKSTIEKELAAIHWAITYFRPYLFGTKFLVKSDHRPLVYLFSMKNPTSKLTRMRLDLEEFCFEIEYIKGKENVGADALSRININNLKNIHKNTHQVLAVTRSMTRKTEPEIENTQTNMLPKRKVYEVLNKTGNLLKLPTLMFTCEPARLRIRLVYKKKVSALKTVTIINGIIPLEETMSQLQNMADDCAYKSVKLRVDSEIFQWCTREEFKEKGENFLKSLNIILFEEPALITQKDEKEELIKKFHDDPLTGGHCGQKRLLKKLKFYYKWKNMSRDVANYVKNCKECQLNKIKIKTKEPMVITPTPQTSFDIVSIDTIGPFMKSNYGNSYAVTIQCELTKYVVIIPIPDKSAATIARAIVEHFILIYGPMTEIRTDMGTEYKNQLFENICKLLKISHKTSTPYHSQTIGGCERNHRVFNEYVRMYINGSPEDWEDWIKYYAFCYNTTPSSYHNFTPFELIFGKKTKLPEALLGSRVQPLYNLDAYDQELRYRLQLAHKQAGKYLEQAKLKRKQKYDEQAKELELKPGDFVSISNENRTKLDPWYRGPFTIVSTEGVNCTVLGKDGKKFSIHKNRVQPFNSA